MLYCIEIERECEEKAVIHHTFFKEPTKEQVIDAAKRNGFNYDDDFGKLNWYEVRAEPNVCEAPSSVERSVYPVLCEVCKIRGGIKMTVKCDRKSCYHCVL